MTTLTRARCSICTRVLTDYEAKFLDTDRDFLDHHGHTIARDYTGAEVPFVAGDRVVIRGGFEDGATGTVVANEPMTAAELRERLPIPGYPYTDRPWRYRIELDGSTRTVGGIHPINMEPTP